MIKPNGHHYGEVLALIPARGGSKALPRKNILPLLGKPLIAYSIEHAKRSLHVTRVLVTTDDLEIAEVAKQYGAEVPFLRPQELSGDTALDVEFMQHALLWLKNEESYEPNMLLQLRPTSPVRRVETIDKAIETFAAHPEVDSLRAVKVAVNTPFKMWLINEKGFLSPIASLVGMKEPYNQPRQRLPIVYTQDAYLDLTRPSTVLQKNSPTGDIILPFLIREPTVDIDYPESIAVAEDYLRAMATKKDFGSGTSFSDRHPA